MFDRTHALRSASSPSAIGARSATRWRSTFTLASESPSAASAPSARVSAARAAVTSARVTGQGLAVQGSVSFTYAPYGADRLRSMVGEAELQLSAVGSVND